MTRGLAAAAAALLLWGVAASAALADRGVAVNVGRIDVQDLLRPGTRYELPTIRVRNPGDEPTSYVMLVEEWEDASADVAPGWVRFTPERFSLEPGAAQQVALTLELPAGLRQGRYETVLSAAIASDHDAPGAGIGAAAASMLAFEVAPSSLLSGIINRLGRLIGDLGGWLIALGFLTAAILVGRRYRVALVRR